MTSPDNDADKTFSLQVDRPAFFDELTSKRPLSAVAILLQTAFLGTGLMWFGSLGSKIAFASIGDTDTPAWNAAYDRAQTADLLTVVFSAFTLGLLIWWTTWAYRNLDVAGRASENPKQVLLSWFIPVVNFLVPGRALEELSVGGRPDDNGRTQPRLVWYFWLTGPVMFCARVALLQLEPLLFPSGALSTAFTGLEWATNLLISISCFVGAITVNKSTAAARSW